MIEWWHPNAAMVCQEVIAEPVTPIKLWDFHRLHINIRFLGTKGTEHVSNVQMLWYFSFYIINKNVSYSSDKMLFKISSKIAHSGLSSGPQNSSSHCPQVWGAG